MKIFYWHLNLLSSHNPYIFDSFEMILTEQQLYFSALGSRAWQFVEFGMCNSTKGHDRVYYNYGINIVYDKDKTPESPFTNMV